MRPAFEWQGDSAEQASGVAQWTAASGKKVSLALGCFATAHELNQVVEAAYQAGLRAGREGLAFSIEQVLAQTGTRRKTN